MKPEKKEIAMMQPVIHNGTLFDYNNGVYAGVLVTEDVMRKLAKLQSEHLHNVKKLLSDAADRGCVFPSMWTLHYPEGKQTSVTFIDSSADVQQRIKSAMTAHKPVAHNLVFIAKSMKDAEAMANAHHEGDYE